VLNYCAEKKLKKPLIALKRNSIIGNSPKMKECLDLLVQAANRDVTVLITGETGTGKELFASAIHENSARAEKNFVVVDCAALPETLVESVLFGYEKSAFTGADKSKDGLIKQADGGTLFLDEVGELPLSLQKSFLRVLQEHRFRPVGSNHEAESNFRLVTATNRDLNEMVRQGKFRSDLFFRLQSLTIELPPLRERTEDLKDLILHHLSTLCENDQIAIKGFSPEVFDTLAAYDWPGNVRELFNAMDRALATAHLEQTLYPKHLPPHIRIKLTQDSLGKQKKQQEKMVHPPTPQTALGTLNEVRETAMAKVERDYLEQLMNHTKGNIKQACKISGLSRSRLYELLKKYRIFKSP